MTLSWIRSQQNNEIFYISFCKMAKPDETLEIGLPDKLQGMQTQSSNVMSRRLLPVQVQHIAREVKNMRRNRQSHGRPDVIVICNSTSSHGASCGIHEHRYPDALSSSMTNRLPLLPHRFISGKTQTEYISTYNAVVNCTHGWNMPARNETCISHCEMQVSVHASLRKQLLACIVQAVHNSHYLLAQDVCAKRYSF